MMKLKDKIAQYFPNIALFANYYNDYKQYSKSHYSGKGNSFEKSQGKIFRQTHIIEKGMSLSHPRKGFGKEKIKQLLMYLDEYIELGYSQNATVFLNAVHVLYQYIDFQKQLGVEISSLEEKLQKYKVNQENKFECGICHGTKKKMEEECQEGFLGVLKSRHSMRQFSKEPLDYNLVKKAVEAAMYSPSECNRQSVKVYVFKEEDIKKQLDKYINGNTGFAEEAKNYLIISSDVSSYTSAYERNQMYVDGSLFAMTLMLSLHYYGIGSCALQNSETIEKDKNLRSILNLPSNERVIMFLAVGHYKEEFDYAVSKRKNIGEVYIEK